MDRDLPICLYGGLTLIATPGTEPMVAELKSLIESFGDRPDNHRTPVDIGNIKISPARVNGEPKIGSSPKWISHHDCVILATGPGTPEMIQNLLLTIYHARSQHAKRISIIFGYFPWSRTDKKEKREEDGMIEYPLPTFLVELIKAAAGPAFNNASIIAFDLHANIDTPGDVVSEVSVTSLLLARAIMDTRDEDTRFHVMSYTDAGAAKRSKEAATKAVRLIKSLGFPVRPKQIDGSKGRLSDRSQHMLRRPSGDVRAIRGSVVFQVDDEASTVGTLDTNSRFLIVHYGAKRIVAVVTHGVFCGKAIQLISDPNCPVDKFYVSDTVPFHNRPELQPLIDFGKIVVVSIAEELAKIIYYTHWGHEIFRVR